MTTVYETQSSQRPATAATSAQVRSAPVARDSAIVMSSSLTLSLTMRNGGWVRVLYELDVPQVTAMRE